MNLNNKKLAEACFSLALILLLLLLLLMTFGCSSKKKTLENIKEEKAVEVTKEETVEKNDTLSLITEKKINQTVITVKDNQEVIIEADSLGIVTKQTIKTKSGEKQIFTGVKNVTIKNSNEASNSFKEETEKSTENSSKNEIQNTRENKKENSSKKTKTRNKEKEGANFMVWLALIIAIIIYVIYRNRKKFI